MQSATKAIINNNYDTHIHTHKHFTAMFQFPSFAQGNLLETAEMAVLLLTSLVSKGFLINGIKATKAVKLQQYQ